MTCSILKPAVHLDNRERNFSYLNGLVKVYSLRLHECFSFKMHTFWLFICRIPASSSWSSQKAQKASESCTDVKLSGLFDGRNSLHH